MLYMMMNNSPITVFVYCRGIRELWLLREKTQFKTAFTWWNNFFQFCYWLNSADKPVYQSLLFSEIKSVFVLFFFARSLIHICGVSLYFDDLYVKLITFFVRVFEYRSFGFTTEGVRIRAKRRREKCKTSTKE